ATASPEPADTQRADHRGVGARPHAGARGRASRRLRFVPGQALHAREHGTHHLGDPRTPRSGGMTTLVESACILVVEDNADTAALLRDLLEAEGYHVDLASTGEA